ncbi:hypothetical protein [Pseudomonas sp. SG20052]|uniref:hypothetical protein n=1 Tax=Pseudomonas sp. SG20052 TaxID=3074147 RepID=UPI00287F880C|nr:hypothetical protein [Pseudomonas sp. SG20052]WNF55369.1 hypothetical protein RHP74_29525 [Pseudomonas sp. SG20052]
MEVKVKEEDRKILLTIPNERLRQGYQCLPIRYPEIIKHCEAEVFAKALLNTCFGKKLHSCILPFVKSHFRYIRINQVELANIENWDIFFLNFFRYYLTDDSHTKASTKTRLNNWTVGKAYIENLKLLGIVPRNTVIPDSRIKTERSRSASSESQVLTGKRKYQSGRVNNIEQKYLIDFSYAKSEKIYFDDIKKELLSTANSVQREAQDYWRKMKQCHTLGRSLVELIPSSLLDEEIGKINEPKSASHTKTPLIKFSTPELTLAWFLACFQRLFLRGEIKAISITEIQNARYFRKHLNGYYIDMIQRTAREMLDKLTHPKMPFPEVISRLLGMFSARDCAVASAILIDEDCSINPDTIGSAQYEDKDGKKYITLLENSEEVILSLSKDRAVKRFQVLTPEISTQVVLDIIDCTKLIRDYLTPSNPGAANYLFLVATRNGFGPPNNISLQMKGGSGLPWYDYSKENFERKKVAKENFNLSAIRSTRGIIVWLETGSVRRMAKALGNTERIVMKSYLPQWLIRKRNERNARIFQQTLILIACAGAPWLLEASDFHTLLDLEQFVLSALSSENNQSDLSSELKRLYQPDNSVESHCRNALSLNLSEQSLTALYTYADWASEEQFSMDDILRCALVDLAVLLQATAEQPVGTDYKCDIVRSNIQGDSHLDFQALNKKALLNKSIALASIKQITVA